jgi:DNA polymerase-3 subunit epsilon
LRFLVGCDLGGFGVLRFDLPLLTEEFRRVGLEFSTSAVHTVDAQRIYHLREPRTLSAALRFYCADDHVGAHGAKADVLATMRVLEGEMARYPDLPVDVEGLGQYCNPRDAEALDPDGRLKWRGTEVVLAFGQKSGLPLRELVARDATYLRWILNKDFSPEVKAIVRDALDGKFPQRSASVPEVEAS